MCLFGGGRWLVRSQGLGNTPLVAPRLHAKEDHVGRGRIPTRQDWGSTNCWKDVNTVCILEGAGQLGEGAAIQEAVPVALRIQTKALKDLGCFFS